MDYNKARGIYNGHKVIRGTSAKDVDKILGLRNDVIYVPFYSFRTMSQAFHMECMKRNIEIRLLPE